ncbi:uncharacterized protein V6R79_002169 [Siganus canaliculatus]
MCGLFLVWTVLMWTVPGLFLVWKNPEGEPVNHRDMITCCGLPVAWWESDHTRPPSHRGACGTGPAAWRGALLHLLMDLLQKDSVDRPEEHHGAKDFGQESGGHRRKGHIGDTGSVQTPALFHPHTLWRREDASTRPEAQQQQQKKKKKKQQRCWFPGFQVSRFPAALKLQNTQTECRRRGPRSGARVAAVRRVHEQKQLTGRRRGKNKRCTPAPPPRGRRSSSRSNETPMMNLWSQEQRGALVPMMLGLRRHDNPIRKSRCDSSSSDQARRKAERRVAERVHVKWPEME